MLGWNDRSKSQFFSREFVICFAVITGVSKNRSKVDSSCRLSNQSFELANIRIRASASSKGDDEMVGGFASFHSGGVNFAFGDAHVTLINETINPDVLSALATRNGGEVADSDEL